MPRAQAKSAAAAADASGAATPYPTTNARGKGKNPKASDTDEDPLIFLKAVTLEGEEEDEVPIYDSCDEIRRKIRAFFRDPKYSKITQKRFREEIGNVNSNTYRRFMDKKGEGCGAESGCFKGA